MDKFSKAKRSKIMRAIKSKNTKPEEKISKALKKMGLKFKRYYGEYKIDFAFPEQKIAIFVDGCFWHMCPKHGHIPLSNQEYWVPKLKRNIKRAKKASKELKKAGWTVIRVWEHEIK